VYWIGNAEVSPRMTAFTTKGDTVTSGTECLISDAINFGPVKTDKCVDPACPTPCRQQVSNAAQITFTLFSNGGDEKD
jgi:hypothetical protein